MIAIVATVTPVSQWFLNHRPQVLGIMVMALMLAYLFIYFATRGFGGARNKFEEQVEEVINEPAALETKQFVVLPPEAWALIQEQINRIPQLVADVNQLRTEFTDVAAQSNKAGMDSSQLMEAVNAVHDLSIQNAELIQTQNLRTNKISTSLKALSTIVRLTVKPKAAVGGVKKKSRK